MNFKKYIGIQYKERGKDFKGVDCFGVCHLMYKEERNIHLYEFTDMMEYNVKTPEHSHKVIISKIPKILTLFEEVPFKPLHVFDLILFYESAKKDVVNHMGIFIGNNQFIHSVENKESMSSRLSGYYESKMYKVLRLKDDI